MKKKWLEDLHLPAGMNRLAAAPRRQSANLRQVMVILKIKANDFDEGTNVLILEVIADDAENQIA